MLNNMKDLLRKGILDNELIRFEMKSGDRFEAFPKNIEGDFLNCQRTKILKLGHIETTDLKIVINEIKCITRAN